MKWVSTLNVRMTSLKFSKRDRDLTKLISSNLSYRNCLLYWECEINTWLYVYWWLDFSFVLETHFRELDSPEEGMWRQHDSISVVIGVLYNDLVSLRSNNHLQVIQVILSTSRLIWKGLIKKGFEAGTDLDLKSSFGELNLLWRSLKVACSRNLTPPV